MPLDLTGLDLTTAELHTARLLPRPPHRGEGYATEATLALAGWASASGAERVVLRAAVGDAAAQGAARRAGFRADGVQRGGLRKLDGTRLDAAVVVLDRPAG
jgi:RimJ/RimL family protein N-acetyltransferase